MYSKSIPGVSRQILRSIRRFSDDDQIIFEMDEPLARIYDISTPTIRDQEKCDSLDTSNNDSSEPSPRWDFGSGPLRGAVIMVD